MFDITSKCRISYCKSSWQKVELVLLIRFSMCGMESTVHHELLIIVRVIISLIVHSHQQYVRFVSSSFVCFVATANSILTVIACIDSALVTFVLGD